MNDDMNDTIDELSVISSEDDLSLSPSSFNSFWYRPELSDRDQNDPDHGNAHAQDDPEDISWVATMLDGLPDHSAGEANPHEGSVLPAHIRFASARPLSTFGTIVNYFAEPLHTSHLVQSGYPEGALSALASDTADRAIDRTELQALMPAPNITNEGPIIFSERSYGHLFDFNRTKRCKCAKKSFPVGDESVAPKLKTIARMLKWVRGKKQAMKSSFEKHRTARQTVRLPSSSASEGNNLF